MALETEHVNLSETCNVDTTTTDALIINSCEFSKVVGRLREFFLGKGFVEVHTQNRLSILAACEDPTTIATFNYAGQKWPLPQTGQMWLEYELLNNPSVPGYFCVSTSYRNEPNPVAGRHDMIFPMFEYELKGDMEVMMVLQRELLEHLGYGTADSFPAGDYPDVAREYETYELEHEHETRLCEENGPVYFLKNFPSYTSPFWNMRKHETGDGAYKVDVILDGMETIGSAERSCSAEEMLHDFRTISNGLYAKTIYNHFGQERVDAEMDRFLAHEFFPRSGGGIGVTRLIRSMKLRGLL
jgi:aspartyl/asparaginyl-tRNA synthetase